MSKTYIVYFYNFRISHEILKAKSELSSKCIYFSQDQLIGYLEGKYDDDTFGTSIVGSMKKTFT